MKSDNGNVFIDFAYNDAVTIGEVYMVNFYCLQRINHLEVLSGTFPKSYDLDVLPVWELKEKNNYIFEENNYDDLFWHGTIIRLVLFTNIHEMSKYKRRIK